MSVWLEPWRLRVVLCVERAICVPGLLAPTGSPFVLKTLVNVAVCPLGHRTPSCLSSDSEDGDPGLGPLREEALRGDTPVPGATTL